MIELARWVPCKEDPHRLEYAGQRSAAEVFAELEQRLESIGYLPDEYFLLSTEWEDREIPRGADIFCTADYGGSEGIYLDMYLKWYENGKPVTQSFATGKTLGETADDLDRMFLVASAITKAFHGDHTIHPRYMQFCEVDEDTGGAVFHLSQQEQNIIMDALLEHRAQQENSLSQTEQLLRRMTGSITAYMDTVGHRPLYISDYDKAVLAIRDGELELFKEFAAKVPDQQEALLIEAAGRPGCVGRNMTGWLLQGKDNINHTTYCEACKKAIDINDREKILFMLDQASSCVSSLPLSFYGEMAGYAYTDHYAVSKEIIQHCTKEQIAAAPPRLLELFADKPDFSILDTLVKNGISGRGSAVRTLHMLTYEGRNNWMADLLLRQRMWVDTDDYAALHTCVMNDAVGVSKLLLDGGMDFDAYQQWAKNYPCHSHEETLSVLTNHWAEMQQATEPEQVTGGMTFG